MTARIVLLALALAGAGHSATVDETFDTLAIGAQVYSNVTVTTKTRTDIFISHSRGIAAIKIHDLDEEAKVKLGYELPKPPEPPKQKITLPPSMRFEPAKIREAEEKLTADVKEKLKTVKPVFLVAAFGVMLLFYVLFCHLCKLICVKAGHKPGFLIWLPVLKWIPLLRASTMSAVWLVAFLLPLLNVVAYVTWAVNISNARGKSGWTALGLCLPVTNIIAFLYLALADGAKQDDSKQNLVTFHPPSRRTAA